MLLSTRLWAVSTEPDSLEEANSVAGTLLGTEQFLSKHLPNGNIVVTYMGLGDQRLVCAIFLELHSQEGGRGSLSGRILLGIKVSMNHAQVDLSSQKIITFTKFQSWKVPQTTSSMVFNSSFVLPGRSLCPFTIYSLLSRMNRGEWGCSV